MEGNRARANVSGAPLLPTQPQLDVRPRRRERQNARVPWAETASETFVARHDERDAPDVERVLAQLEYGRERL